MFTTSYSLVKIVPSTNTRKFYAATARGNRVSFVWGRIGTRGQSQNFTARSANAAREMVWKKVNSKMDRGYEMVSGF